MAQSPFRRSAGDDVVEAAQRRLDLLRRELAQAGLPPPLPGSGADGSDEPEEPGQPGGADPTGEPDLPGGRPVAGPAAGPVARPGRHVRRRGPAPGSLLGGWLLDRLPATLQGRVHLGQAQTALVAVIAALGLAAAAVVVLRSGSGGSVVVPASSPAHAATTRPLVPVVSVTPVPTAGPGTGAAATAPTGVVVVDVAG